MCRMCEDPTFTRADHLREMARLMDEFGWALQFVTDTGPRPPWAYTVGLTRRGLPELVITGLPPTAAGGFLNDHACFLAHQGRRLDPGMIRRLDTGRRLEVVELAHPDLHLTTVRDLFPGEPLRALQLVWGDDRGRWPWEAGFRGVQGAQPVLGPRAVPSRLPPSEASRRRAEGSRRRRRSG